MQAFSPAPGCFFDGTATGGSVRASAAERRVVGDNEGLWWCVHGLGGRSVFVSSVEGCRGYARVWSFGLRR